MSIRLIAYLSAAALAAVVLAYGRQGKRSAKRRRRRMRSLRTMSTKSLITAGLLTLMLTLTGCQTPVPVQNCPRPPALSPALSATPEPTYRERLQKVWLLPQSATSSRSDTER